jgi:hypothetical protein
MIADDTIRDANTLSLWARLVAKGIIQLPHRYNGAARYL